MAKGGGMGGPVEHYFIGTDDDLLNEAEAIRRERAYQGAANMTPEQRTQAYQGLQNSNPYGVGSVILPGGTNIKSGVAPLEVKRKSQRCENCGAPTFNGYICTYCGA